MRYKLLLEYDGTDYHGWQVQPNGRTLQGVLEAAVLEFSGETVRISASGRTDAGVHAIGQVVSFALQQAKPTEVVCRALNALTPRDIAIRSVEHVDESFDPRRAARSRRYVYRIWNEPYPSPFWRRYTWHVARPLDVPAMQEAAALLLGEHDFTSLRASNCEADNPVRRVYRSDCQRDRSLVIYTIEATAFLKHMVRNIVGTLVEVGLHDRPRDCMTQILAAHDRRCAGQTAPPSGLCLTEVQYDTAAGH